MLSRKLPDLPRSKPSVVADSEKKSPVQDNEKSVEAVPATKQTPPGTKETAPAVKTPAVAPGAAPAAPATQKTPAYTEEMVKAQFEGKGIGEKISRTSGQRKQHRHGVH